MQDIFLINDHHAISFVYRTNFCLHQIITVCHTKTSQQRLLLLFTGINMTQSDADEGPGAAYKPFIIMEELLDKLKLMDYEQDFVMEMKMRPLNRHYFVVQTNPGEQFFIFSSLAAWLIRMSGHKFDAPQEFDDPNGTIANILDHVRRLGSSIDFAPSKLKQGYGEQALFVLDILCNDALKSVKFEWKHPIIPSDDVNDDEIDDEDAEVDIDR